MCDCAKGVLPECEGEVEAEAVFYKNKAYEAQPNDARLGELVDKMMMDEVLTDSELQELDAIRLPWADIIDESSASAGETGSSQ